MDRKTENLKMTYMGLENTPSRPCMVVFEVVRATRQCGLKSHASGSDPGITVTTTLLLSAAIQVIPLFHLRVFHHGCMYMFNSASHESAYYGACGLFSLKNLRFSCEGAKHVVDGRVQDIGSQLY